MIVQLFLSSTNSQRLKDQENRYEEYTESKIQLLMKSVKKSNKRMRSDEDPDEEYVPSIFLFREQRTVEVRFHFFLHTLFKRSFGLELLPFIIQQGVHT